MQVQFFKIFYKSIGCALVRDANAKPERGREAEAEMPKAAARLGTGHAPVLVLRFVGVMEVQLGGRHRERLLG